MRAISARAGIAALVAASALTTAASPASAAPDRPLRATSSYTTFPPFTESQPNLLRFAIQYTALGDINGDGADDWANAQGQIDTSSEETSTSPPTTYVTFGQRGTRNIDHTVPTAGVRTYENLVLKAAGDVNGDGTDDVIAVIIGAEGAPSVIAVLFGGPGIADVRLDRPGVRGFQISGAIADIRAAGDVNGDGRHDLITYREVDAGYSSSTPAAILFGKSTSSTVNGLAPGKSGTLISAANGVTAAHDYPHAVGDFNGDRLGDLALNLTGEASGVLVLWGARTWSPVNIANPGARGRALPGVRVMPDTADFTGDRRDDLLLVGLGNGQDAAGNQEPSVLPGDPTRQLPLASARLLANAFVSADPAGFVSDSALVPVGDQNGDGRADLLALSPALGLFDPPTAPGNARLVLGRATPGPIDVEASVRVGGAASVKAIRGIGDTDGDKLPDVLAVAEGFALSPGPIFSNGADILAPAWLEPPTMDPSSFKAGTPTNVYAAATEEGRFELVVRRASGEMVGTFSVSGGPEFRGPWDGRIGGRALPAGDYRTTVTPIDPSGNRGPAKTVEFTILP